MAAHPFGPIENQLIVGYYKRGFSPAKVKPILKCWKHVQVFDHSDPEHYLLKPVFYGWSPANGNSSSHDFRVKFGLQAPSEDKLLSRGLGYRITFTMPEQEIRTEDPTSWPRGVCEILDFTGSQTIDHFPLNLDKIFQNPDKFNQGMVKHLSNYRVLGFEKSLFFTKVVENETDEYLFPVYSPPGSSIDERHLAAAERHRPVLGAYIQMVPGSIWESINACTNNLCLWLNFLQRQPRNVSAHQKQRIRLHLESAASDVKHLCSAVQHSGSRSEAPQPIQTVLPRLVNDLESDIRKWLDDEGPFPKELPINAIKDFCELCNLEIRQEMSPF